MFNAYYTLSRAIMWDFLDPQMIFLFAFIFSSLVLVPLHVHCSLIVTEIMFNADGATPLAQQWVELKNIALSRLTLPAWPLSPASAFLYTTNTL